MVETAARESSLSFLRETWNVIYNETIPTMQKDLEQSEWLKTQTAGMGLFLGDIYKAIEQSLRAVEITSAVRGMLKYRHRLNHGYGAHLKEDFIRKYSVEAITTFNVFTRYLEHIYPEIKYHA